MAMTGVKTYRNPNSGTNESAVVVAPVIKMYDFATRSGSDKYVCAGVVGNRAHLTAKKPGDHTWFSTHSTIRTIGGPTIYPKRNWIYAGDFHVPEPEKFERWLLARLRAGVYLNLIKYFNINNRHWNRKAIRSGKMFAYSSYSGDKHFHCSWMPGAEYALVDLFGDFEHYRTTGKNRTPAASAKPATGGPGKPHPAKAAAAKLPAMGKGSSGRSVRILQAALVAQGYWPPADASKAIDGEFGTSTEAKVKKFQTDKKLKVMKPGVVDAATWNALLPDAPPVIQRGTEGYFTRLAQCLLIAWGHNPGYPDSEAGDTTIAALKKFQVAKKVTNSVVAGKGDGIGGAATWVAFLTV